MSRYLVSHVEWGVMAWSAQDQRLVSMASRSPWISQAGGVPLRLFASANAARRAIALTCQRMDVADLNDFRLTRVDRAWTAVGGGL